MRDLVGMWSAVSVVVNCSKRGRDTVPASRSNLMCAYSSFFVL